MKKAEKDDITEAVNTEKDKTVYEIEKTVEFAKWFKKLGNTAKVKINARLALIENSGHFGVFKRLGEDLFELKWRNGIRVYYSIKRARDNTFRVILLLNGGDKDSQSKDILRAKVILKRI